MEGAVPGPIACSVGPTPVSTPGGSTNIEDLAMPSHVLSHDANEGSAKVIAFFGAWRRALVHIVLEQETITCTPEHPFWVVDRGWVHARNLRRGCHLLDGDGRVVPVVNVVADRHRQAVRVYNMTVDGEHTYYVGKSRVLVHNKQ